MMNRAPGINCPNCGCFISTTIAELLIVQGLKCESCGLEMKLDRQASAKAISLLQEVDSAQKMVESKSKFNR
ncbi:MAG: hypothetical protein LBH34_04565 [Prevotellaceae bacterium]|jgi:transcription elongation factor Elf1|nr:hypothetical protein [Prevotellaceae bacterium]